MNNDLVNLQSSSDSYMNEIHTLRDQYKADLVVLLEVASGDYSELAYVLSNTSGNPGYGFSVVDVRYAVNNYTFAHEIGHNFGLGHHKQQSTSPGPGIFPYAAGWKWKASNAWNCTVMTYESGQYFVDLNSCSRTPYFSSPNITYQGYTIGNSTEGDAALALRETKHLIAAYSYNLIPKSCTKYFVYTRFKIRQRRIYTSHYYGY